MQLVIISGRSGSGKSSALDLLEDEGYYCIDNLPVSLLPALMEQLRNGSISNYRKVAICIDARNAGQDLKRFSGLLRDTPEGIDTEVVYLDADDATLIKRFSETRRRHPLSDAHTALAEAIRRERELLEPIAALAQLTLDTSAMNVHELRGTIKERLVGRQSSGLSLQIMSFGFKRGVPVDADLVFDLRMLPNPHWDPNLRTLTGRDQPVVDFLEGETEVAEMFEDLSAYLSKWLPRFARQHRSYITVAIGCTGGQHRSVYMAERLGRFLATDYQNIQIRHRELS